MKRAVRWLRRVYPPSWAVGFVLAFYVLFELPFWLAKGCGISVDDLGAFLRSRDGFMLMAASGYAVFRVGMFHPLFRDGYRRWLEQTPWTADKPLPLGPVYIVVQDVLMLVFMRLLLHDCHLVETALPQAFLFSYLIVAAIALSGTGERSWAHVVVFGFGLAILANWWSPLTSLGCLIGAYLAAAAGIRRSLRQFPWDTSIQQWGRIWRNVNVGNPTPKQRQENCGETEPHPASLGWPHNQLSAYTAPPPTSLADRIVISLLAGWLLFAVAACPDDSSDICHIATVMALAFGTFACALGRLSQYCVNHWPPISLWGRFWTLRWIIPGYDKVFVAPLLTLIVGWGGFAIAVNTTLRTPWYAPMCGGIWALTLMITAVMGPSFQCWRLTASARTGMQILGATKLFEKI